MSRVAIWLFAVYQNSERFDNSVKRFVEVAENSSQKPLCRSQYGAKYGFLRFSVKLGIVAFQNVPQNVERGERNGHFVLIHCNLFSRRRLFLYLQMLFTISLKL